jgi:hypothetical protein
VLGHRDANIMLRVYAWWVVYSFGPIIGVYLIGRVLCPDP